MACIIDSMLPQDQQVARGQELLQILWQPLASVQKEADTDDVDVKIIVKGTFIDVVDPRSHRAMKRSMSDSELLRMTPDSEQPWTFSDRMEKKMQDLHDSDASTMFSKDDASSENSGEEYIPGLRRVRSDTCWSDDDGTMDGMMQSYMPYGYDTWCMPMFFDPNTNEWMAMDGSMMQWAEQTMEGGEIMDDGAEWRTTVMLRNMPNNYTRDMLMELVDSMGFEGCYDFAYLPVDFKSQAGLGYAFINFVSSEEAQRCFDEFEGFSDWKVPSEKVCTVTWGSPYQGLEAHIERYQNSPVMHHSIPDEWKPVLFLQGERVEFPPPTKPIKTPKIRQQPAAN